MQVNFENITAISGGVWVCAPVSERPELTLTDWAVFELQLPGNPGRTRHLAGYNVTDREGRASSAIVEFDPATWRGVTKSGRVYGLRGMPGLSGEGEYVWRQWLGINGATDVADVTNDLLKMMVPG